MRVELVSIAIAAATARKDYAHTRVSLRRVEGRGSERGGGRRGGGVWERNRRSMRGEQERPGKRASFADCGGEAEV